MKRLENFNNEKFQISEKELEQIKGGMAAPITKSTDQSYNYYYTGDSMDSRLSDTCTTYDD